MSVEDIYVVRKSSGRRISRGKRLDGEKTNERKKCKTDELSLSDSSEEDNESSTSCTPHQSFSAEGVTVVQQGSQNIFNIIGANKHQLQSKDMFSKNSATMSMTAMPETCRRWEKEVMDYCATATDFPSAIQRLYLAGVSMIRERGTAVFFSFRDLSDETKLSLQLTTAKAVYLFGERFVNEDEGLVDFPKFREVRKDAENLFDDLKSGKSLERIIIGNDLIELAERCPEFFQQQENSHCYRGMPDFLGYKSILQNEYDYGSQKINNFLKVVNSRIILWVYSSGLKRKRCDCNLPIALFQNKFNKFFFGCERFFYKSEERCDYSETLWMSRHQQE